MTDKYWRNVWRVPDEQHSWRQRLENLEGDLFLGAGHHESKEAAEVRAEVDERHFVNEMGMSVRFVRTQCFEARTPKGGV